LEHSLISLATAVLLKLHVSDYNNRTQFIKSFTYIQLFTLKQALSENLSYISERNNWNGK